jgi:hypothetical protein
VRLEVHSCDEKSMQLFRQRTDRFPGYVLGS